MIFDSSVWINYSIGKKNGQTDLLDVYLQQGEQAYLCPPILQEVLQGIREPSEYSRVAGILHEMIFLRLDSYVVAEGAANLYRSLRAKGITIRKPNDCIIAFYAMHFKLMLAHNDADFDKIAKHTPLKVYKPKK